MTIIILGSIILIIILGIKFLTLFIKDKSNKITNNVYKEIELSGEEFKLNDEQTSIKAQLDSNKWKINFVDILIEGTIIVFKQFPVYNYKCLLNYVRYDHKNNIISLGFNIIYKYMKSNNMEKKIINQPQSEKATINKSFSSFNTYEDLKYWVKYIKNNSSLIPNSKTSECISILSDILDKLIEYNKVNEEIEEKI